MLMHINGLICLYKDVYIQYSVHIQWSYVKLCKYVKVLHQPVGGILYQAFVRYQGNHIGHWMVRRTHEIYKW